MVVATSFCRAYNFYNEGIFDDEECNNRPNIEHAVGMFGFGEEDGQKYWKIRNSWGENWGE